MREFLDLRLGPEDAAQYLPPGIGKGTSVGGRKLLLNTSDPLVDTLRTIEAEHHARGKTIFTMCEVTRRYTASELHAAERLLVTFWPFFMPTGEECETIYDESTACSYCGVGARQASPLRLKPRSIPKTRDIAPTLGGEYIISKRLAHALEEHGISGYELHPITSQEGKPIEDWFQIIIPSATLEIVPPTLFGSSYLAPEPDASRCPHGHVAGHRLLSPLHLARRSLDGKDWGRTHQYLGLRSGLGRPQPMLVISQRLYRLFKDMKVRSLQAEVAHLR